MDLVYENSSSDADFEILCVPGLTNENGSLLAGTVTTGNVEINTTVPNDNPSCPVNTCYYQNVMMHEIGHLLGLGHTGIGSDGDLIDGTGLGDNESVFIWGDCNSDNCDFSINDIIALETLYPSYEVNACNCPDLFELCDCFELSDCSCPGLEDPIFDITYNGPVCIGDMVTFNVTPTPGGQNLSVISWDISDGAIFIMTPSETNGLIEAQSAGTIQVCVRVLNSCGNSSTQCTTVEVQSNQDCQNEGGTPNPK